MAGESRSSRGARSSVSRSVAKICDTALTFDNAVSPQRQFTAVTRNVAGTLLALSCFVWLFVSHTQYGRFRDTTDVDYFVFHGAENASETVQPSPYAQAWSLNPHLVAIGVMMGNDAHSSAMRAVQRTTWVTYPDVARLENRFTGLVLPLYVAGLKTKWPPYWDPSIKQMADHDGDILVTNVVEQISTTGKGVGERRSSATDYGSPSMMTNARKVSVWFRYAYHQFPLTPFLAKADLDTYINVPAYLTVLQQLPRVSTKFGRTRPRGRCIFEHGECLAYILGPLYTNTRDIAREVFTEPVLARTFSKPYTRCKLNFYRSMYFLNEDLVHSRSLHRQYADGRSLRPFPEKEYELAQIGGALLPPVAGMGKLYMDYLANPNSVLPLSGSVAGLQGYHYLFTLPEQLNRSSILFVLDNCRFPDYENATLHGDYHLILHHTYSAKIAQDEHEKHKDGATFQKLMHPTWLNLTSHRSFYYQVALSSLDC